MSGWFNKDRPTEPIKEKSLPGHTVAQNADAAKIALDNIQDAYTKNADAIMREFSEHADAVQGKTSSPEWPA